MHLNFRGDNLATPPTTSPPPLLSPNQLNTLVPQPRQPPIYNPERLPRSGVQLPTMPRIRNHIRIEHFRLGKQLPALSQVPGIRVSALGLRAEQTKHELQTEEVAEDGVVLPGDDVDGAGVGGGGVDAEGEGCGFAGADGAA